jgi:hypothetical protein
MQLMAILNSIEKHKRFVYQSIRWDNKAKQKQPLIEIKRRRGSKGICSGCGQQGPA